MTRDFFHHKADSYDKNKHRVANVDNIANAILASSDINATQHIMDFGSGTGLLLERIAPYVNKITAVDVSPSMNEQLATKRETLPCELELLPVDLTQTTPEARYDGIISSMTLHHIEDIADIFSIFYRLLKPEGFIALADLDKEDGSFHTEDTGVFHHGFERRFISDAAKAAGFRQVNVTAASTVHKPHGDYPVFLLSGQK